MNYRAKYYFPNMPKLTKHWIIYQGEKNWQNSVLAPLQNPNEFISGPEDALKIDIVSGFPTFVGYEHIVTAVDVFSRYLFAYTTANQFANTIESINITKS